MVMLIFIEGALQVNNPCTIVLILTLQIDHNESQGALTPCSIKKKKNHFIVILRESHVLAILNPPHFLA